MASPTHPPLLHLLLLPPELLDTILSHLSSPRDLLSFALASRACAHLAVPAHTQYRVLRVRTPMPALWAHLARRRDLAGNVRELWMCRRGEAGVRERVPAAVRGVGVGAGTGLGVGVRSTDSHGQTEGREEASFRAGEETRMRNVCIAVGNMTRLTTFVWEYEPDVKAGLRLNHAFEEGVLKALIHSAVGLRRLALRGQCAAHVREGRGVRGGWYPMWKMKGLESISLLGTGWIEKSNTPHVVHMLRRQTNLESLEIPSELPSRSTLSKYHLPHLKRLKLTMVSGALTSPSPSPSPNTSTGFPNPSTEDPITTFLESHPALEDLNWTTPLRALTLSPTALPALRRLKGARQIIDALDRDQDQDQDQDRIVGHDYGEAQPAPAPALARARPIECLDIRGLEASRIARSSVLDPRSLRKVRVTHVGARLDLDLDLDLGGMYAMAGRFKGVTWLGVFGDLAGGGVGLADWLALLPSFPALEVFRGPGLWNAVQGDKDRMHGVILELVGRCPRLRQLDHCEVYEKTGEVKVVRIFREEEEERGEGEVAMGRVWYEVWKPMGSRDWFDTMGGTFD